MQDAELGFIHRPNSYNSLTSLNRYGLRNREDPYEPKPKNGIRVLVMGGSTTFGFNLADGDTYPEQLEALLRAVPGLEKSQVFNGGTICYAANHNLLRLKRLLPVLQPDYVLIYEGINENSNEGPLLAAGVRLDAKEKNFGLVNKDYLQSRWLWNHSVLLKWLDYRARRHEHAPGDVSPEPMLPHGKPNIDEWETENFKWALREVATACHVYQARPIFIRYATVAWALEGRYFSDLTRDIARQDGILLCDMEERFNQFGPRKLSLFIYSGVHVTPEGAGILAQQLFDLIQKDRRSHA